MPKLYFDFKQQKLFYLLPTGKNSFKLLKLFFQLNLLVGSDLIER
jgi:hypothetical protein